MESITFDGVKRSLAAYTEGKPLPTKVLHDVFIGNYAPSMMISAAVFWVTA